ncbi:SRPBCC family protein [Actinomadura rubrisoli]|uniref:SRPBCC family protein n=1 Tax=Actinomadura rubrisoli TaxID=2530368 RepID=A0A4V2YWF4_9ACTN|nr:SRPBCC family protein [Actinomadura rubrisoli]TDD85227.1 SRPBCC family protein [Actinomadura rubrisoli]
MTTDSPRFADCPVIEVDVLIDAPRARVWDLVSDLDLPARFSEEFKGARWADGVTAPAPGCQFYGSNENPLVGTWTSKCTVVEYEPERVFAYTVADLDGIEPSSAWRYTLDDEDGRTRLRQSMRIGPGRSYLSVFIESAPDQETEIVAYRMKDLKRNMRTTLTGVKELAEAAPSR